MEAWRLDQLYQLWTRVQRYSINALQKSAKLTHSSFYPFHRPTRSSLVAFEASMVKIASLVAVVALQVLTIHAQTLSCTANPCAVVLCPSNTTPTVFPPGDAPIACRCVYRLLPSSFLVSPSPSHCLDSSPSHPHLRWLASTYALARMDYEN
jgi:hypothetical protein